MKRKFLILLFFIILVMGSSLFLALPLLAASNPVVSSVSPIGGPLVGSTTITITGSGFIDGATVSIGGVSATNVIFGSSTSLTAITPAGTGMQSVVVTNPDTQSSNTNITFTYAAAPIVTAITPSSGLNSGSLNITNLEGTGFLTGATVQLQKSGQTSISGSSVSVVSPTQITCTFNLSGAGTGTWNVVVTNTDTQFGTLTNGFTVTNPAPTVTSVAPSGGPLSGGTSITITGTGFISGATVKIGTNPATGVNVTNSTTITAATPAGTGMQSVVVTNPDTQSSNTNITFTYAAAPIVTAITPSSGLNSGSLNITNLEGTGFLTGATVQLQKSGQTSISGSSVSVVSPTQITCTFNLSGAGTGTWNVVVTNTDTQFGTLTNGFTVTNPAPTVTSVAPSGGPLSGGTSITITGTGFISGATVKIGTNPATGVNVTNSTTITAATPAGTGMQSVVVTNPDTQSSNTNITFTYAAAPIVTAITPSSGLNSGSLNITNLEGTGFLTGATVQLQKSGQTSISGSSVSVVSPTQITCTFNLSGAGTGTWNVVVTNTDTQFGTLTNGFTVTNPAPTVTSVAPSGGPLSGGTSITITGTGFISGATVKIGTNPATGVNVTNSTTITAATPAGTGTQSVVVTNPDTQSSNTNITFTYAAASKLFLQASPILRQPGLIFPRQSQLLWKMLMGM